MSNTVNNGIPFVPENTIDPAAGLNESLLTVDALLQLAVVSVGTNTPPGSPANGARYVVGTAPTGAWAGRANQVAQWLDGAWRFYAARYALNTADGLVYVRQGATWSVAAAEWTAATVDQAEAETGTATTRRAWTAERVRQAIVAWWNSATSAFGRGFVAAADAAAGRAALELGNVDNTSDANKPVSTATQTALNLKANTSTQIIAGTGLAGGGTLDTDRTLTVSYGTTEGTSAQGNDSRLSNSREWIAETVSQPEAEAGTATTRRAWTAQRVRQAIVAWWNGISSAWGRGFVAAADAAAGRAALGLVAAATEATPNTLAQRDSAGSLRAFETVQTGAQIRAYPDTSPEIRTFKSVAAWNSNANPSAGTIKITLPFSWTSSMLILDISGFNYTANSSWSMRLSGFNQSTGAWSVCSASTKGSPPPFTSVRFAHDGTRCCILLGVTTTSMVFPKIVVDRVVVTNAQTGLAWGQGWSIEQITSEAGITVSATPAIFGLTANPNVLATFTLATLPSAAANPRLQVYCSNLTGQPAPVFSDGTNWRRVSDNTIAN